MITVLVQTQLSLGTEEMMSSRCHHSCFWIVFQSYLDFISLTAPHLTMLTCTCPLISTCALQGMSTGARLSEALCRWNPALPEAKSSWSWPCFCLLSLCSSAWFFLWTLDLMVLTPLYLSTGGCHLNFSVVSWTTLNNLLWVLPLHPCWQVGFLRSCPRKNKESSSVNPFLLCVGWILNPKTPGPFYRCVFYEYEYLRPVSILCG